jgi:hypothetical protein
MQKHVIDGHAGKQCKEKNEAMKAIKDYPSKDKILSLLTYSRDDGNLRWIKRRSGVPVSGAIAGGINGGYIRIKIGGTSYYAHRLVAILLDMPITDMFQVDHIDQNKLNNRPENLRLVAQVENSKNRSISVNNKNGITGVYWHKRDLLWESQICINYKNITVGRSDSFFEACCSRKSAEVRLGFHKNHGNKKGP